METSVGALGAALLGATALYLVFNGHKKTSHVFEHVFQDAEDIKPPPLKRNRSNVAIPSPSRQFSDASESVMKDLAKLEKKFDRFQNRFNGFVTSEANSLKPAERKKLGLKVSQLSADVEKFLSEEVDAVMTFDLQTGKELSRRRRKTIVAKCETLQTKADNLKLKLNNC